VDRAAGCGVRSTGETEPTPNGGRRSAPDRTLPGTLPASTKTHLFHWLRLSSGRCGRAPVPMSATGECRGAGRRRRRPLSEARLWRTGTRSVPSRPEGRCQDGTVDRAAGCGVRSTGETEPQAERWPPERAGPHLPRTLPRQHEPDRSNHNLEIEQQRRILDVVEIVLQPIRGDAGEIGGVHVEFVL
jgi:hypothetical protein